MQQWHRDASDEMLSLSGRGHGNQVVGHGDDGEEQNQQKSERHEGAPRLPGVAQPHRTRPEGDEKQ